jgi:hypothetical protein
MSFDLAAGGFLMTVYISNAASKFFTNTMPDVAGLQTLGSAFCPTIYFPNENTFSEVVPGTPSRTGFASAWEGRLLISGAGLYTFCTMSDDGSTLAVNGSLVVDNGGMHGKVRVCSAPSTLSAGFHLLYAYYFQAGGAGSMEVTYSGPDTGGVREIVKSTGDESSMPMDKNIVSTVPVHCV